MFVRASQSSGGGDTQITSYDGGKISGGVSQTITANKPIKFVSMSDQNGTFDYSFVPDFDDAKYIQNNNGVFSEVAVGSSNRVESVSADRKIITLHAKTSAPLYYTYYY